MAFSCSSVSKLLHTCRAKWVGSTQRSSRLQGRQCSRSIAFRRRVSPASATQCRSCSQGFDLIGLSASLSGRASSSSVRSRRRQCQTLHRPPEFDIGFNLLAGDKDVPDPGFTIGARDVGGFVEDLGLAFAHGPACRPGAMIPCCSNSANAESRLVVTSALFLLRATGGDQVLGDVFGCSLLISSYSSAMISAMSSTLSLSPPPPAHPDHVVVEVVRR